MFLTWSRWPWYCLSKKREMMTIQLTTLCYKMWRGEEWNNLITGGHWGMIRGPCGTRARFERIPWDPLWPQGLQTPVQWLIQKRDGMLINTTKQKDCKVCNVHSCLKSIILISISLCVFTAVGKDDKCLETLHFWQLKLLWMGYTSLGNSLW